MPLILQSIKSLPKGTDFQLEDLTGFHSFSKPDKIAMGRIFSRKVKSGQVPGVIFIGKDVKNHSMYRVV